MFYLFLLMLVKKKKDDSKQKWYWQPQHDLTERVEGLWNWQSCAMHTRALILSLWATIQIVIKSIEKNFTAKILVLFSFALSTEMCMLDFVKVLLTYTMIHLLEQKKWKFEIVGAIFQKLLPSQT